MNNKIAFFTEMGFYGKIDRDHPNMKTMEAWICALHATHIPLLSGYSPNSNGTYSFDLGIVVIPKNWFKAGDELLIQYIEKIVRKSCKKVAIMQEGPNYYFQDYDLSKQFQYYNAMVDADFLLCHNQYDVNYYSGLVNKRTYVLQSLMITDSIHNMLLEPHTIQEAVMIGGNFVSWYGGFDSYIVAKEMNIPIYAPSMGRKQDAENGIEDITYLPYVNWVDWIRELKKVRYGVHLMRTYAAGTFALNCAKIGIPCIGYENLDTQRILHPDLTVKEGDIKTARILARRLADKKFYDECTYTCLMNYEKHYQEKVFLEKFNTILEKENV